MKIFGEIKNYRANTGFITIIGCLTLHYLIFDRYFLNGQSTLSGDTQIYWSLEYLVFYSIKHYGEFLWWDPTGLNGYQAYLILFNNLNYSNIFQVSYLLFFKFISFFIDTNINLWLVFQKTTYYFSLNLILIYLISRKILKSNYAIAFVCITFTLCQYQFLSMRDSYLVQQLPAALLFLYTFISFFKLSTKENYIYLGLALSILISSTSYSMVLGPFYWLGIFILSYFIFYPDSINKIISVTKVNGSKKWLIVQVFLLFLIIMALCLAISPILIDEQNMLRVPGAGPIDFAKKEFWGGPSYGSPMFLPWSNLMNWAPFSDIHDSNLKFDPWGAGLDHKYIGIATLPLVAFSFLFLGKDKLIAPLFVAFFICSFIIPYTFQNGLFSILMEKYFLFKNSRSMPWLLPRDGPSIFLILISGIAFDQIISINNFNRDKLYKYFLLIISITLLIAIFSISILILFDKSTMRLSLTHIGVYLIVYALILIYIFNEGSIRKRIACSLFLIIVTCDLLTSAGSYWNRKIVWNPTGAVPQHTYPNPLNLNPLLNPNWAGAYRGIFHNVYTSNPFYGKREWLFLALNPKVSNLLTNWNPTTSTEISIPSVKFYDFGVFQQFESVNNPSRIPTYQNMKGCLLNEQSFVANGVEYKIEKGFSGFVETVSNGPDIVNFYGWATDKDLPAVGVATFVNNQ
ncbi:MAG: hypothetical protein FJZ43_03950, partial [Candidatus Staskawiczbacteria bacterium]|nr:hypothetical protein [Candidatus Staskawiczbacteria bacterium]